MDKNRCEREAELLHDYLEQIDALNTIVQQHVTMVHAGIHRVVPRHQYESLSGFDKQLEEVRKAYGRLIDHRQSHGC